MSADRRFERYIRIPAKPHGRDFDGCDCWGLVRLVLLNECKIELPRFGEISPRQTLSIAKAAFAEVADGGPWGSIPRGEQRCFDVAVMRGPPVWNGERHVRAPVHFGVMLSAKDLLHVWEGVDSMCLPLSHSMVKPLFPNREPFGFWRHRDLA